MASTKLLSMIARFSLNSKGRGSERQSWRTFCPEFRIATSFYTRHQEKKASTENTDSGRWKRAWRTTRKA